MSNRQISVCFPDRSYWGDHMCDGPPVVLPSDEQVAKIFGAREAVNLWYMDNGWVEVFLSRDLPAIVAIWDGSELFPIGSTQIGGEIWRTAKRGGFLEAR